MNEFIAKYQDQPHGAISGFDRLVFHGHPRTISSAHDMEIYLALNRILKKDFGRHVQAVSERLKQASLAEAIAQARPVIYMENSTASKEDLARSIATRIKSKIRNLGEALDAHRKRQQALFPSLGITDMYNVLEKLRSGEALSERERQIHEQGLVSVLRQLHDDLDDAVFEAYGWPASLTRDEILTRLVTLNAQRAAAEHNGLVRWLRPEYQSAGAAVQTVIEGGKGIEMAAPTPRQERTPWPPSLSDQVRAIRAALAAQQGAITPDVLARRFTRARAGRVEEILNTLVSLGQARHALKMASVVGYQRHTVPDSARRDPKIVVPESPPRCLKPALQIIDPWLPRFVLGGPKQQLSHGDKRHGQEPVFSSGAGISWSGDPRTS